MRESVGLAGVDLHLGYHGHQVVDGASLRIEAASVTALVGPNGGGKSTLLRPLARLHKPESGEIAFPDGQSALALSSKDFARPQLPAGLLTALIGAPYFVYLLWRTRTPARA